MKRHALSLLALAALTPTTFANLQSEGSYLHTVTRDHVTPHLNWGMPSKLPPLNVLAITHRRYGARELVEYAQRFPINYEAVVGVHFQSLAIDDIYDAQVSGTSAYEKERELMGKLERPYDLYLLGNFEFKSLPEHVQYKILKAVSEGAGLVIFYAPAFPYPKVLVERTDDARHILAGVSPLALPDSIAQKEGDKLLTTYRFGKGRIARAFYGSQVTRLGMTPPNRYAVDLWRAEYENSMALAGRIINWAGGRSLPGEETRPSVSAPIAAGEKGQMTLPAGGGLHLRLRDAKNHVLFEHQSKAGEESLALPPLVAGQHFLDYRKEVDGSIVDVGVVAFEVTSPAGVVTLLSGKRAYEAGEPIEAIVKIGQPLEQDAVVSLTLDDLPDQNRWAVASAALPKGEREVAIKLDAPGIPTVAALAQAVVQVEGAPIAEGREVLYFPRRQREIFPTILWESVPAQLSEMVGLFVRDAANGAAALSHPGEKGATGQLAALFDQRFVPYIARIGLPAGKEGQTLNAHWLGMSKTEAEEATKGDGSVHNPAVLDFWKQTIARQMEGMPEIGPMVYTLGDENYFSYEAGYSEADQRAFPLFLKGLYGDIAKLNTEWGTTFTSFEAVGHPTPAEMREQSLYPQWYAHRRFMEQQYADLHHQLATEIKAIDPHALVGSEGSQPGHLEETIRKLDFWGPYNDVVFDELLRCIGQDKLRAIWWGYSGEQLAYPLWSPLLKGVVNANQWYTANVTPTSGFIGVDLTLARYYREERKPFIDALEAGAAPLLIKTPLQTPRIAILWSHASYSAAQMDDRFFNPRDAIIPLLDYCYKMGLNFDLLTTSMLEQGDLGNYRLLFLPGASALSAAETESIERFAKQGGVVVADLNPGVLNDSCGPLSQSRLATFFGVPELKGKAALEMKPVAIEAKLLGKEVRFSAEKAYQSPEAPLFKVTPHGKGAAVLLNFNFSSARNTAQIPFDDFLGSLLGTAAIAPEITISGIERDRSVLRVRQAGDYQLIGLLAAPTEIGKTAEIALGKKAWIYEVDRGEIGQNATISAKLDLPFKLYSVFSQPAKKPTWKLSKAEANPGEEIALEANALEENGVYRLSVTLPDGEPLNRSTSIFAGRKPMGPLRFAHSDPPGRYTVRLTDVRTGLFTESTFILKKANLTASHP